MAKEMNWVEVVIATYQDFQGSLGQVKSTAE